MSNIFYESHWGQCLELLSHLCQHSEDLLLVSGPSGIGKTTIRQALTEIDSGNFVYCKINATTDLSPEDLTQRIEHECDNHSNQEILLLIDDAQNLSLDVIAVLLQLKLKALEPQNLHIVLFATQELEQKISRSVLKEDFFEQTHIIEIEPLTLSEMEAFLMHQWRNAHNNDDLSLRKSQYKKIYNASHGVPGKVLQVAKNILSGKSLVPDHATQRLSPFTVGVTVSFGVLFCVLAVLWPTADDAIITKSSVQQPLEDFMAMAAESDVVPQIDIQEEVITTPVLEVADAQLQIAPVQEPEVVAVAKEPALTTAPEAAPVMSDDEKIARLEKKLQALQEQLDMEQTARRAAELQFKKSLYNNNTTARKAIVTKNKISNVSKQEKHILSFPSENYALQLLGSNDEKKVQAFIKNHNLSSKAFYYQGTRKGRAW